jgi:hypothetical protein
MAVGLAGGPSSAATAACHSAKSKRVLICNDALSYSHGASHRGQHDHICE